MIQYSAAAQHGRAHLLKKYNDVLIFVEDETCQNMHIRIFSKMLEGVGKIQHVFPLRGRSAVINAAVTSDRRDPKVVYVIDGDLDRLTGRTAPAVPNLYQLKAYCIENLLLSERAVLAIAAECAVDDDEHTLRRKIDFLKNKSILERLLVPLFHYYAVVNRLDLAIETVKFSVIRLCRSASSDVDARLVVRRIRGVRKQIISTVGWQQLKEELAEIRRIGKAIQDKSAVVSAKDYWVPLVHRWLGSALRFRDSRAALTVRLASHIAPDADPHLREFLRSVATDD